MFDLMSGILQTYGLNPQDASRAASAVLVAALILFSTAAGFLFRFVVFRIIHNLIRKSATEVDDVILDDRFLGILGWFITPVLLWTGLDIMFPLKEGLIQVFVKIVQVFLILTAARVLDVFLDNLIHLIQSDPRRRAVPVAAYIQVAKVFIYLISFVFAASTLLEKDPWGIVTGIGALTAVLVLVFKDLLQGITASVQISGSNIIMVGDRVEVPAYGADGEVTEMTMTQVKIHNWNGSVSTVPTYALVTGAFRNWRGVEESGTRRIKRSILIDVNSIAPLDSGKKAALLKLSGDQKYQELINQAGANTQAFRAYITSYLFSRKEIIKDKPLVVRHLEPKEKGLPIQIYCFIKSESWEDLERIQSEIFDHILSIQSTFGLKAP